LPLLYRFLFAVKAKKKKSWTRETHTSVDLNPGLAVVGFRTTEPWTRTAEIYKQIVFHRKITTKCFKRGSLSDVQHCCLGNGWFQLLSRQKKNRWRSTDLFGFAKLLYSLKNLECWILIKFPFRNWSLFPFLS